MWRTPAGAMQVNRSSDEDGYAHCTPLGCTYQTDQDYLHRMASDAAKGAGLE